MDVTARIKELGASIEQQIIADRRHLHMYPELSFQEVQTQRFICERLDQLGIEHISMAGTGVVGTIRGTAPDAYDAQGNPAHRIGLRADMDALPTKELTGVEYASRNEGVMHACGHDCHVAMLLGTAEILVAMRDQLHGEVRLIFQPSEETADGSRQMMAEGVLDGVDTLYGTHIWSDVPAGTVNCPAGQRMANVDWFRIDISGFSAHGSMPHKGVDAVVVAAELVVALQVLVSRDVSPFEPTVVTIGEVHGGSARNIVAGSAYLTGTTRTWSTEARAAMRGRIEKMMSHVASGLGAEATLTWEEGNRGLVNDPVCAARAEACAVKLFGEGALSDYEGTLAGEDFAELMAHVPGVFVFLGTNNPELGATYAQHSCYYTVDESVLVNGSMLAAQYAVDYLQG
ncbi:MAG: amidohydrolase [Eggerthellaceae bacterium]|nr:amidohydrolase [Eggerthellaceae bacterium]